jgi:hypothetical protein
MNEHLKKIKDKDVHYVGKDVQNEIIKIISDAVKKKFFFEFCFCRQIVLTRSK